MYFLLFDDFKNFHRAIFNADAAGDALGCKFAVILFDHQAEGACFLALAAANAELLVYNINALCILRDSALIAGFCAFTALNTDHGLCSAVTGDDLQASLVLMEFLIKSGRAGTNTLETSHALSAFFYRQFFHFGGSPSTYNLKILYNLFQNNQYIFTEI